eukprot:CAMPEP_0117448826 /NCGR_PEP_ID=MMETSP0759-20121206/7612_1 /TAXON_ID=63605 /ORGANISM="Percolomonas cosmopolitus, Strain WS" /LENGTH=837 /DNA_ID=CAMNT_0005241247 /DNA_START=322 /DNA_END=2835 /DNA_ORIENTATION=+
MNNYANSDTVISFGAGGGNPSMGAQSGNMVSSGSNAINPMMHDSSYHQSSFPQHQRQYSQHAPSSSSSYQDQRAIRNFLLLAHALSITTVMVFLLHLATSRHAPFLHFIILSLIIGSFYFCYYLVTWILRKDASNREMKVISDAILEGADEYLNTQYWIVGYIAFATAVLLFLLYLFRDRINDNVSEVQLGFLTALSFLVGAFCSALAGYVGVWISARVNIRCAQAASHLNFNDALRLSFRGGAVASILATSMCTLGIMVLFGISSLILVSWGGLKHTDVPMTLVGYGFGASFIALFMQLGGGIYTKAADVGADMVGKIEQSIPEDDPRNAATIADLVGDMVGDCNGSMADVFESLAGEIIGTMILGATLANKSRMVDSSGYLYFPLAVHALDVVASIIGVMLIKSRSDREDPLIPMRRAYTATTLLAIVGFFGISRYMLYTDIAPQAWWYFFLCGVIGIIMSYLLIYITQYYTDYKYAPVKKIADASVTGAGTNAIAGLAVGMESTGLPILVISVSLISSFYLGQASGLDEFGGGVFGCAVASMGMLCTAGFVLSQNNMGPIADGSNGIVEMAGQSDQVREITDRLDAVGNVVKAATKGYAVGGSALACFVLFHAFLDEMSAILGRAYNIVNITQVEVIVGGLCGITMIFVFSGWTMDAVGRAAQEVVQEVRRQFRDNPGIMDGSVKPEYGRCVRIVTQSALKEMIRPAALALLSPLFIGYFFRWVGSQTGRLVLGSDAVAGFLIFSALTALVMSTFLNNAGGAWDNAKKLIETGYGGHGKNSLAHAAAVTGDTIGDPCKDSAGPSLSVIITTMSTTVLTLAPFFVASGARVALEQ